MRRLLALPCAAGALAVCAAAQLPPLVVELEQPTPEQSAFFGRAVAGGDVDGDGFAEVVSGAPLANVGGTVDAGRVFVASGPGLFDVTALSPPAPGVGDEFGDAVATGDVDGDGFDEVVVGSDGAERVFVFEGPDLTDATVLTDPTPAALEEFGISVAVGDVDGDGFGDVAVGSSGNLAGGDPGEVHVFFGPDLTGSTTLFDPTPEAGGQFGFSVAAGDVDGNGVDDVAVGVRDATAAGVPGAGEVHVFFGPTLAFPALLLETQPEPTAQFGFSVAVGDATGDGLDDVLVGVPKGDQAGDDAGEAVLFEAPGLAASPSLVSPDPSSDADFGFSVAIADVTGDGVGDALVGEPRADPDDVANAGRAHVFAGPSPAAAGPSFDGPPQVSATFGIAVAAADVDGDGTDDAIVGADGVDESDLVTQVGATFVHVTRFDLGLQAASVPASTGGTADFVLDAGAANAGRTFTLLGSASGTSPATPIGQTSVPLVTDAITTILLQPPFLGDLSGTLGPGGEGALAFAIPPVAPAFVGVELFWAWVLVSPIDTASAPVVLEIAP